MREISQNFPTVAPSLAKIKLDDTFRQEILSNLFVEPGRNLVLLNGRVIEPDTIDCFT